MGFFKKLFKSGKFYYRLNHDVLSEYINEQIRFLYENSLSSADEFYLMADTDSTDRKHIMIINYDVPCKNKTDWEKDLQGTIIYVNDNNSCDPETDRKYSSIKYFIECELKNLPEEIILFNDLCAPVSLEPYRINHNG